LDDALLVQLVIGGPELPGLSVVASTLPSRGRGGFVGLIHVAALTSPPDVDALRLHHQRSSGLGVIAMGRVCHGALAAVRRRLRLRLWAWRTPTALGRGNRWELLFMRF
jgi:hypothetical protein